MLTGDLVITYDLNKLPIYAANYLIVSLSESDEIVARYSATKATILLPPYEAVCAEMDNNVEAYYYNYYNHLSDYSASSFIASILKVLKNNLNVCLYIPEDSRTLTFNKALPEYFANNFGIIVNVDQPVIYIYQNPQVYNQNPNLYMNILCTLYMYTDMTIDDLFIHYPQGLPIAESILPKLIQEYNAPLLGDASQYTNYFFQQKEKVKANNNVFLVPGMVFGD